MTMQPSGYRHKITRGIILTLICLSICMLFFISGAGNNFLVTDNNSFPTPDRLIMQVIDNQFHKWYEYDSAEHNQILIYQVEPLQKQLTSKEAANLLKASKNWEKHYLIRQENIALDSEPSIEQESLADNRTAVTEYNATQYPAYTAGFLSIQFPDSYMRGSGFLVSPHTVLTNAHNVYNTNFGGWFDTISFSPGQYETQWPDVIKPFSTLSPLRAETNDNYLLHENNNDRDNTVKYDYAALFFDEAFNGISTFVPLEFSYTPNQVFILGYPGVVRDTESQGMWRSDGAVKAVDDHCLYYEAYTSGGNSGGPVLVYNQQADTFRVVAIHSFAFDGDEIYGGGPHLNAANQLIIEEWLLWAPETTTTDPQDATTGQEPDPTPDPVPDQVIDPAALAPGDVNGDGIVNVLDAALVMQHVLLLVELDEAIIDKADVNQDDLINIVDITLIMQYSLGIIKSFH